MSNAVMIAILAVLAIFAWNQYRKTTAPTTEVLPPSAGGGGGGTSIEGYVGGDNASGAGISRLPDGSVTTTGGTGIAPTGGAVDVYSLSAAQVNQALTLAYRSGDPSLARAFLNEYNAGRITLAPAWIAALQSAAALPNDLTYHPERVVPVVNGVSTLSPTPSVPTTRQIPGSTGVTQSPTGETVAVVTAPSTSTRYVPTNVPTEGVTSIATRGIAR